MNNSDRLPQSFYLRNNVVEIARDLLGKKLVTCFENEITSGIIVETEAYAGVSDRASHAFGGRYTSRTSIMYKAGGTAYVYFCYGMHSLFNVVTNVAGVPDAVLIRGIKPLDGIERMMQRTGKKKIDPAFGNGPGRVSKCLGIHCLLSGLPVTAMPGIHDGEELKIWIEDYYKKYDSENIVASHRIGVGYAGEDARLPYRFELKGV